MTGDTAVHLCICYSSYLWKKICLSFIQWSFSSWTFLSLLVYLIRIFLNVVYVLNSWVTQLESRIHFTVENKAADVSENLRLASNKLHSVAPRKPANIITTNVRLMFIGSCIIAIVDEWKTNLMSLTILFHLLCAQHVSDINISIFRSLRLSWWITTSVVLFCKYGCFSN